MKITTKLCGSLFASVLVTTGVSAQEFYGTGTLGYSASSVSAGGGDISTFSIDAEGGVRFENGFEIGVNGSFANIDPDQLPGDAQATDFGLDAKYTFSTGFSLGAYVDHASLDISGFAVNPDITSYGVSFGYTTGGLTAEGFIGASDVSPSFGGVDVFDVGGSLQYELAPNAVIGAHVVRSTLSGAGVPGDIDLTAWGLAGAVDITQNWTLFGGLQRGSVSQAALDANTYSIGGSYNLQGVSQIPAILSLEYARSTLFSGGPDVDSVRFGVTIPLGNTGKRTIPLNSTASSIMTPRHNAISTTVDSIF